MHRLHLQVGNCKKTHASARKHLQILLPLNRLGLAQKNPLLQLIKLMILSRFLHHFLCMWSSIITFILKKFDFQRQMLQGASGLSHIFPLVLLASGGVTMAVRGAGGHSMGHLPPQEEDGEQGKMEALLFSDVLGEQPVLFGSLGREPSRNLPHNHNDDPSNEANG